MNMKTTKFLAVLAVLVMAFAAVAIIAPADSDDASNDVTPTEVTTFADLQAKMTDTTVSAIAINATFEITANIDLTKPVTINASYTTTVNSGITMTVSSDLTVEGILSVIGTVINDGKITIDSNYILINGESAKITSTTTGEIIATSTGVSETHRAISIVAGTFEKQNVTVNATDRAPIQIQSTGGKAVVKNNTFDMKTTNGIRIYDGATGEIEITGNTFTSEIYIDQCIILAQAVTAANGVCEVTITKNDFSGVKGFAWQDPSTTAEKVKYGKQPVQVAGDWTLVTAFPSAENGAYFITDSEAVGVKSNGPDANPVLTIASSKTLTLIGINVEGQVIVNAGVTLTANVLSNSPSTLGLVLTKESEPQANATTPGATFIGEFSDGTNTADLKLKAGSADVTISKGSVVITGTIAKLDGSKIEQISGDVALNNLTVPEKTTLDIYGKVTGTITNDGTVDLETGANITGLTITNGDKGKVVDNTDDDDMEELVIGGNSMGDSTTFSSEQKVIVSSELGYWTLNSGSKVTILGALVIPAGTVMTVQAGAELVIDNLAKVYVEGTLVIDTVDGTLSAGKLTFNRGFISVEGLVSLNGTLAMDYTDSYVTELDVENGGSFIVGETGSFTVTVDDTGDEIKGSEFFVAEGGELTVYGLMGSTIWNSGEITIDSDVPATEKSTIYMWTAGATVDVVNYTIKADKLDTTLTISDKGMIFTTYREQSEDKTVYLGKTEDKVVIKMAMTDGSSDYSITFSGLKVVSGSSAKSIDPTDNEPAKGIYNNKQYSKYLDVSGLFYVDYTYIGTTTGADKVVGATVETTTETSTTDKLNTYCAVKVTDAIVINDYVTLNNAAGVLTVTGSIDTMSKDAKVTNAATITVDGAGNISCVINTISSETGINAAKFMTVATDISGKTYKIYNYYSIDGALAVVAAEPVTSEIIILGKQTMKLSATLPAGISLVLINSSASLTINKDVTFEIEAGAPLKGEGTVNVNGSMYANEKTDVKNSVTVISDVKTEEMDAQGKPTKTGWALWTNLTDALAAAQAGDVITITKKTTGTGYVTVSKNLTIPEGVTLVAPNDFDPLLLKNGVTLTIDGILVVGSNIYAEQAFGLDAQNTSGTDYKARYSSAIVVNGALISTVAITYGNGAADTVAPTTANANKVALIGGQYAQGRHITFTAADGPEQGIAATAVTAPIAGAYYTIKGGNVTYKAISSLEFAADNLDAITSDIEIYGYVGGLMLSFAKTDDFDMITVHNDTGITAPTSMATGSTVATELTVATLVLNEVSLVSTANGTFTGIVGNGTDALTCVDVKSMTVLDKDDKLYVSGAVIADTTGAGLAITAGAVYLGTSGTGGTQFAYTGTNTATIKNYLTVADDAEAIVENCGTINLLWIEGYFGVPAAKSANVTNLVDLGEVEVAAVTETTAKGTLTIKDMFVGADAMPIKAEETAIATISGPITLTGIVYTMGDAIIGLDTAAYLATLPYTTFMIGDEEYYTVFNATGEASKLVNNTPKILEAVITGWYSEDGKEVVFDTTTVGTYPVVYAYLNYNIYSVYIVTDAGVKSVAINGIEMVNQGNNVFTLGVDKEDILTPLIAGTYKVTYTLKSGYQEDKNGVTLYTEDGTILKDLKFEASGASILTTIKLQLNGTEIIPEPEPTPTPEEKSEWTVTTILLCVLVVLIAIMAVIVALRLNRN